VYSSLDTGRMVSNLVSHSAMSERPPHLKRDNRNGTWIYRRVIPPRLRSAFDGKAAIVRSLGTSTDRLNSREFKRAYEKAKAEVDQMLRTAAAQAVPLTQRDTYGLMRELIQAIEASGAADRVISLPDPPDPTELLRNARTFPVISELTGDEEESRLAIKVLLQQLAQYQAQESKTLEAIDAAERFDANVTKKLLEHSLEKLGIRLTEQQKSDFLQEFEKNKQVLLEARSKELKDLNFNSIGGILEKLPEPPSHITSWQQLRDSWIDLRGGRRSDDGLGLSDASVSRAEQHWSELQMLSRVANPSDLTTEMVRKWIRWMKGRVDPGTVLSNLKLMKAILRAGVAEGLLKENVAETLTVSVEYVEGYVPFTDDEVKKILIATRSAGLDYQKWLPRLAIYTGARIEELAQLRREDIRTVNGVLCFDIVHRPKDELQTFLKGKRLSERQVPIHPWVQAEGFMKFCEEREGRLFLGSGQIRNATVGPSASRWFRRQTQSLGIWVERKKVFHSFRGTFKDNCRKARIDDEVHHAWTGHVPKNEGDKKYGIGLRKMPEITVKEMLRLPNP